MLHWKSLKYRWRGIPFEWIHATLLQLSKTEHGKILSSEDVWKKSFLSRRFKKAFKNAIYAFGPNIGLFRIQWLVYHQIRVCKKRELTKHEEQMPVDCCLFMAKSNHPFTVSLIKVLVCSILKNSTRPSRFNSYSWSSWK